MNTSPSYYQVLGVTPAANRIEICQAYKELALQYHPSLKHDNENEAYNRFCKVAEAFDVLYNDEKRQIYDQYGEQYLKENIIGQDGKRGSGNYTLAAEPEVIFEKFFGSKNVYEHLLSVGEGKGQSHPIFSSQYGQYPDNTPSKVKPLVVPVECLLSEIFNGCKKIKSYPKEILTLDGQRTQVITETKEISISAGYDSNVPIVFKGQGNQYPGETSSDLIFQLMEVNTMGFQRCKKNPGDLIYTAGISLMDALDAKSLPVKQLNGQIIHLHFDQIIHPQTERVLEGKGMPTQNGRGNLIVKFNIDFPEQIDIEKKSKIVQLLVNS